VTSTRAEFRIVSVGLHNVGLAYGAIVAVGLIGAATLGRGLSYPSLRPLLILLTLLWAASTVALELNARTGYVAVVAGRLRWRLLFEGWRPREQPVQSVGRVELSPKGDLQIYFNNGRKPLLLSAKAFRRADLDELVRALSTAAGRDLMQAGPASS
jgi:hypothetical protein